jgi:hypothetical protein
MDTKNKQYETADAHIRYIQTLKEYNRLKEEFPDQNNSEFYKKVEEAEREYKRLVLEYRTRIYTDAGLELPEIIFEREILAEKKAKRNAIIRKKSLQKFTYFAGVCLLFFVGRETFKAINEYFYEEGFTYVLSGTVTNNHNNAEMIYMGYNNSTNILLDSLLVDSAKIVNGKFKFKGKTYYPVPVFISPDIHNIYYRSTEKTSVLYIEPQKEVTCIINLKHPFDSIKVYNSPTDNDFRYAIKRMKPFEDYRVRLWHQIDSLEDNKGDTIQIAKLKYENYRFNLEYIKENLDIAYFLSERKSPVAFNYYFLVLIDNENLTTKQLSEIEDNFMKFPEYIRNCKSGKRVSRMIEYNKIILETKNR